ncbi:MAG: carbamoyl-phosphate synthase large subunit, partial [Clostridia bacterium]|nr:carbamoyl-phosphate synthase large subunit [Clostridia bacterium]
KTLGTQMKATGEVMSISNSFESALLKAVTSLEVKCDGLRDDLVKSMNEDELMAELEICDDERIFAIAELLRRDEIGVDEIAAKTGINKWFIDKINNIILMEKSLKSEDVSVSLIAEAEKMGFTDKEIIDLSGISGAALKDIREYNGIFPVFKKVDGCKVGDEVLSPYYYSCMGEEDEAEPSSRKKILVIGSGPIRIGQGIEFDYCCVKGVWALKDLGYESVIINNNPETVSTDFDTSDKLYFEALHIDDVMNVIKKERPEGVILQFGGQTALNLAESLSERGIKIYGTSNKAIEMAEDREMFSALLKSIDVPQPRGISIHSLSQAGSIGQILGFPVIVRPSFVIGGRAMQVVYNEEELETYLKEAVSLSAEHPVLVDKYIEGIEFEIDAIGDGEDVLIPGIMEHIERTGIHSGDSISVYPADFMDRSALEKARDYLRKIVKALNVVGLVNVQYVYDGKDVYIIEVNPRASRTVPILSKATGVPMVYVATEVMLGAKLKDLPYGTGLYKKADIYAVKVPVFSGAKLPDMEVAVGPEMRSTGEALGIDKDPSVAMYKGFAGAGVSIITEGGVYVSLRDHDKNRSSAEILKKYALKGFKLYGSLGTSLFLKDRGIECKGIKLSAAEEMLGKGIDLVINVPQVANNAEKGMFGIRRKAIEKGIPVLTCMDTAG